MKGFFCFLLAISALVYCQAQTSISAPLIVARLEHPGVTTTSMAISNKVTDTFDDVPRGGTGKNWRGRIGTYDDLVLKTADAFGKRKIFLYVFDVPCV